MEKAGRQEVTSSTGCLNGARARWHWWLEVGLLTRVARLDFPVPSALCDAGHSRCQKAAGKVSRPQGIGLLVSGVQCWHPVAIA